MHLDLIAQAEQLPPSFSCYPGLLTVKCILYYEAFGVFRNSLELRTHAISSVSSVLVGKRIPIFSAPFANPCLNNGANSNVFQCDFARLIREVSSKLQP